MKFKEQIARLTAFLCVFSLLIFSATPALAANPSEVAITIDGNNVVALTGAQDVGSNIEMSMTSDAMWQANGNWMEQSFFASEINIMRWGYDAWAFNWEDEVPLSDNRYWGGLNTKDAAGTFGLEEFIDFCKKQDIIPFVMIPIESLDTFGGEATLAEVKALTTSMAQYIAAQEIELCYFDMGNEPWNNGASGTSNAEYLGGLFPEFQQIIKDANPNYRLVLQRAPENILWNSWNSTLVSAAQGAFDAYDDHRYAFYGWDNYFDENSDDILTSGTPIDGKEAILGECNIGWTPIQDNWDEGHVRDMGGSMALLNAMLDLIDDGTYSYIISWPSHYPSNDSIVECPNNSFGWFDLDQWYLDGETVRLPGPALAHRIINQNVLDNKVDVSSNAEKVRVFAYTNNAQTDYRVIVLNKWDATTLTFSVPSQINSVSAMVMSGESVWDTTPSYVSLFAGTQSVSNGTFSSDIPGESVIVYTFSVDASTTAPQAVSLVCPENNETVGTAQAFVWSAVDGCNNYRLIVDDNADFSSPVIDTYTGKACRYQNSDDLAMSTTYYWKVIASNTTGTASSNVISFSTIAQQGNTALTLNDDSVFVSHSSNWNQQTSGGSYRNDDMSCEKKDGFAEFTFTGTRARIYGIKGDWCGYADIQVDFGYAVRIDTYSATLEEQALFFDTGELPYGQHTVTLTVAGEKNDASSGTWIEYDKVEIEDSMYNNPIVDTVVWNDENPNLDKSSVWTHQSVPGSYHDDDSASNTWLASIEFTFNGTNAVIYGLKGPWCGKMEVKVDGVSVGTIDTYATEQQLQQVLYDTGILEPGEHTVKIIVKASKSSASSGKWIEIDKVVWK